MPRTQIHEQQAIDPDFLSEAEHVAIGDSAPHHARAHTLLNVADHTDVAGVPSQQSDSLRWETSTSRWTVTQNNIASSAPTVTDDANAGYVVGSRWLHSGVTEYVCLDATVGAAVWFELGAGTTNVQPLFYSQSLGDNSNAYLETNNTAYTVLQVFSYDGTGTVGIPNHFEIVGSRSSSPGGSSADVRIWDSTNSLEIATINFTASARAIYTTSTITNLPTGVAEFELQARRNGSGRTQVWFAELARI